MDQHFIGQVKLTEGYRIENHIYTHIYEKAWEIDFTMTHRLVRVISNFIQKTPIEHNIYKRIPFTIAIISKDFTEIIFMWQ